MTNHKIYYKNRYKYMLVESVRFLIDGIHPPQDITTEYYRLTRWGVLTINKGYAWDGPSGPTIDTKTFMRGSLVHDVLYQMMRHEELDRKYRKRADEILREYCRKDGMGRFRAWYVYRAVRMFGENAASEDRIRKVLSAP